MEEDPLKMEWKPVEVKVEPSEDVNFKSEGLSTTFTERHSGDHLENSVFCSVIGIPFASEPASSAGQEMPDLSLREEIMEEKHVNFSGDFEVDFEASCTTFQEPSISDFRPESNVFCPVNRLPLASDSAASSVVSTFTQQIKVENIKDEDGPTVLQTKQNRVEIGQQKTNTPAEEEDCQTTLFCDCHQGQCLKQKQKLEGKHHQKLDKLNRSNSRSMSSLLLDSSVPTLLEEKMFFSYNQSQAESSHESNLDQVFETHLGEGHFSCEQCPARFSLKDDLNIHLRSHKSIIFSCSYCQRQFNYKRQLDMHLRTHTGERPFACDQCPARYSQKSSLKLHLRSHKSYTCEWCQAQFRREDYFKHHVRMHTGEKFTCEQCQAQFNNNYGLKIHLRKHSGEKPFACQQCPARFREKCRLKKHLQTHTGVRPFSCEKCQAQFHFKSHLKTHLQKMHSSEKTFCKKCQAQFNDKSDLKVHLQTHLGEKCFSCKVCSKRFFRQSDLNTHAQIHSGEKPFSCELCQAQFSRRSSLNLHLQTHLGKKPFSCEHCQAQFGRKGYLTRHLQVHSGEKPFSSEVSLKNHP